jgi:CRP-like cAMP-binding protein
MRFTRDAGIEYARTLPGLADLSRVEFSELSQHSQHVGLPAQWTVIHEGTPADGAYLVLRGEVRIVRDGREIARLGPGRLVGEVALLEKRLRTASVVTTTATELLKIDATDFERWVTRRPHLRETLLTAAGGKGQPDHGAETPATAG